MSSELGWGERGDGEEGSCEGWGGRRITARMTTELTFDEPRDVLPDEWDTLTVRVCSDGSNLTLEFLCSGDNIFRKRISCQLSERRPFQ
jgi:hypothetical protein